MSAPCSERPGSWGPPYSTPPCAQRSSLARLLENASPPTLNVFLLCLQNPNPSLLLEPKQCTMEGPGQPPPSLLWCLLPSPSCFPFLFVLLNVKWACRALRSSSCCRREQKWISHQQRMPALSNVVKGPSTLARACAGPRLCSGDSQDSRATRGGPRGREASSAPSSQCSRGHHGAPPRSPRCPRRKVQPR